MSKLRSFQLHRYLPVVRASTVAVGSWALAVGLVALFTGCAGAKRYLAPSKEVVSESPFRVASYAPEIDTGTVIDAVDADLDRQEDEGYPFDASPPLATSGGTYLPRDADSAPDSYRDLTENELLALALSNSPVLRPLGLRILENPAGTATIYDTAIAASDPFFGPQAALAEFDSVLSAGVNAQNNDRVFNNRIEGGNTQQLVQDLVNLNAGWQQRQLSGAIWDVKGINGYDANNRIGNTFPNYWEAQLEAGVRQPLLQGAGREFNSIAGPNARPGFNFSNGVIIARLNNRMSDAEFAIAVRNFVRDLYSAYWDLERQYRNYENVLKAQSLAFQTWQSVLAKSKANLAGGEANKEAQARAKYYRYRHEVQVALGGQGGGQAGLYVAERRLRNLIGLPIVDGTLLRPSESPVDIRYVLDFDSLISRAMVERSELTRQALRVRQQRLRLIAAKNFLLPQMDLIGRYRLRGLGDDLTGTGPRFSSAYQDFFSFDHQEWEFGLEMGVVAGRRQARAAVQNATLQVNREQAILCEQQRVVRLEVSDAYAEVSSSYLAMETSQAQVDASRERLESSEALFAADKIQIEFLLDAQEELVRSQLQLAADQTRYTMSLIAVNAAVGSLLADVGIHIQQTSCRSELLYLPATETEVETLPEI